MEAAQGPANANFNANSDADPGAAVAAAPKRADLHFPSAEARPHAADARADAGADGCDGAFGGLFRVDHAPADVTIGMGVGARPCHEYLVLTPPERANQPSHAAAPSPAPTPAGATLRRGGVLGSQGSERSRATAHAAAGLVPRPQPYEVASLIGAALGFFLSAWHLLWAAGAPLGRQAHSTTIVGGGGLCATVASSLCGSYLALCLADVLLYYRPCGVAGAPCGRRARPLTHVWQPSADTSVASIAWLDADAQQPPRHTARAGPALGPEADAAHATGARPPARRVPLASRRRPDAEALVTALLKGAPTATPDGQHAPAARAPHAAPLRAPRVACGGPPALLRSVAAACASAKCREPLVRLTNDM